jgi:hypothetical protein
MAEVRAQKGIAARALEFQILTVALRDSVGGSRRQLGAAMFRLLHRLREGATAERCRITFCEWDGRPIFPREIADIVLAPPLAAR